MGLHHVAMNVRDFDASKKFYQEAIGASVAKEWGETGKRAALIDVGGNYVEIFEKPESAEAEGRLSHFALRCDDPDAAIERVRSYGAEIRTEPKSVDIPSDPVFPVRIAFCYGPDREVIEFFQEL